MGNTDKPEMIKRNVGSPYYTYLLYSAYIEYTR